MIKDRVEMEDLKYQISNLMSTYMYMKDFNKEFNIWDGNYRASLENYMRITSQNVFEACAHSYR